MSTNVSAVVNHFPSPQDGFTTTTSGPVSGGASTVGLNSTGSYSNGDIFVGIVDPGDADKKQAFTGVIDTGGSQVTGVKWTSGTNQSHTSGATVVDYVAATHIAMMSKGMRLEHGQDGTHDNTKVMMLAGTQTVAGSKTFSAGTAFSSTTSFGGAMSGAGYSMGTMSNPYKFSAYNSGNQTIGTSQTQVTFNTELYDTGSNYASNAFTAPIAGFYHFDATLQVTATASLVVTYLELRVNGAIVREVGASASASNNTGNHISADLQLSIGDVVTVFCAGNVSFTCNGGATYLTWFDGHLIGAT